jgi:hypothetical protein
MTDLTFTFLHHCGYISDHSLQALTSKFAYHCPKCTIPQPVVPTVVTVATVATVLVEASATPRAAIGSATDEVPSLDDQIAAQKRICRKLKSSKADKAVVRAAVRPFPLLP